MSVRRSNGPTVSAQFLHPIHQPILSQGSQDQIGPVSALFWASTFLSRGHLPVAQLYPVQLIAWRRGMFVQPEQLMNPEPVTSWRARRRLQADEIGGILLANFF